MKTEYPDKTEIQLILDKIDEAIEKEEIVGSIYLGERAHIMYKAYLLSNPDIKSDEYYYENYRGIRIYTNSQHLDINDVYINTPKKIYSSSNVGSFSI